MYIQRLEWFASPAIQFDLSKWQQNQFQNLNLLVWDFFSVTQADDENVVCNMCKRDVKRGQKSKGLKSYSTAPLHNHLKRWHKSEWFCLFWIFQKESRSRFPPTHSQRKEIQGNEQFANNAWRKFQSSKNLGHQWLSLASNKQQDCENDGIWQPTFFYCWGSRFHWTSGPLGTPLLDSQQKVLHTRGTSKAVWRC